MYNENNHWHLIDKLVYESNLVIDRPLKARFIPNLKKTHGYSYDWGTYRCFCGIREIIVTGTTCSVDLVNRGVESIILIGYIDE